MRFAFASFLFAFWASFAVTAPQSYWMPMASGMVEQVVPVKPIKAPRQVLVWNQFDEGQYGARVLEFEEVGDTGKFKRGTARRVNTLASFPYENDQQACSLILGNSVMKRIDSTSFHDMGGIHYFPAAPDAFDKHIESSHSLHHNQSVYFETTSWLSAKEALDVFGGIIPWSRIVEVLAPAGLTQAKLTDLVNAGPVDVQLRIRRATLRLVAGQFIAWEGGPIFSNRRLPLETDISNPRINKGQTPFTFELGRASQMKGLTGEAELLVPFALAVADHTRDLFSPLGSDEPMPPDTVGVHVLSLDRAHTTLFRRLLGMKVTAEKDDHSVLSSTLDQIVLKQRPSERLASLAAIHEAVPGRYSELGAMGLLRLYRSLFRRDLDLNGFTTSGPIVVRDYSPINDYDLHEAIAPSWRPISDDEYRRLKAALDAHGKTPSIRAFANYEDDFGELDWQKEFGVAPLVLSNLNAVQAAKNHPDYVTELLIAVDHSWHPTRLPPDLLEKITVVVATKNPTIEAQALACGMKRLTPLNPNAALPTAYALPLKQIADLIKARPDVWEKARQRGGFKDGYWKRHQTLTELYGL